MIGFAPPLPRFRNADEYISVVEHALGRKLTEKETVLAIDARGGGFPAHRVIRWLELTASPSVVPPPLDDGRIEAPLQVSQALEGEDFRKEVV